MASNNPVALPLLLTVTSLVIAAFQWETTPDRVPIWWNVHAHPIAWVPRWFGLLLLPVLQLAIPYIMYQVATRDRNLEGQSGESAYAIANIIALPAVFLFAVYTLVYVEAATSDDHYFLARIFTTNVGIWPLFWLGYNLQYVEPNSSIGVPSFVGVSRKDLWARTHKRAGLLLMISGAILFIFALVCTLGVAYLVVSLLIWIGSYALVILYSYVISRSQAESFTDIQTEAEDLSEPLMRSEP